MNDYMAFLMSPFALLFFFYSGNTNMLLRELILQLQQLKAMQWPTPVWFYFYGLLPLKKV
jgi:type III secretory pathway component EscT